MAEVVDTLKRQPVSSKAANTCVIYFGFDLLLDFSDLMLYLPKTGSKKIIGDQTFSRR